MKLFVSKFDFRYLDENETVLRNHKDLFFEIPSVNVIKGYNGSGKTTFMLILCGIVPKLIKGELNGQVYLEGKRISEFSFEDVCSYLYQNPYLFFRGYTVKDEITLLRKSKTYIDTNIDTNNKLEDLISDIPIDLPIYMLSGGQQQKLALYILLKEAKKLILLDEPFEYLDKYAVEIIQEVITKIASMHIVFISLKPGGRFQNIKYKNCIEVVKGTVKDSCGDDFNHLKNYLQPIHYHPHERCVLNVESLRYKYANNNYFELSNISFCLRQGESLGIIGPNGSGKTTLLMLIAGLLNSSGGKIYYLGEKVNSKKLRKLVKINFQNPDFQIFANSVYEELAFGLKNERLSKREIEKKISEISRYFSFSVSKNPLKLSYGQKKLLSLISVFLLEPKIVLLDEPTASLDYRALKLLRDLIQNFLANGGSVILSSHDERNLRSITHRIIKI